MQALKKRSEIGPAVDATVTQTSLDRGLLKGIWGLLLQIQFYRLQRLSYPRESIYLRRHGL